MTNKNKPSIVVIGAGPAGLFAAQSLAKAGAQVTILNRDIKPGGLAEYGIYYDKYALKEGLRKQFRKILASPDIAYYGNVKVGQQGDVTLEQLRALGFSAMVVTVGAQGTKWLGLPGEDLRGVYHAKPILYAYNRLPPFSEQTFAIGKNVALIGVGNVMADIAHWLVRDRQVASVVAVARRGPAEVKFTRDELSYVARNMDLAALDAEFERTAARMTAVQQDPDQAKAFILSALETKHTLAPISDTQILFRFLSSPRRILGDDAGNVIGLEVDNTELVLGDDGATRPQRLGTTHTLAVDTVIFCIGDKVSADIGLPVARNAFVKNSTPRYPVNGVSYEVFDPEVETPIPGTFVAGWAREASKGLVGLARKDALACSQAVMQYIAAEGCSTQNGAVEALEQHLRTLDTPLVTKTDWQRLETIEQQQAEKLGSKSFKFKSNAEMLTAMKLL